MWLDYSGIVPGVAAALMGVVTLVSKNMPRWQKGIIIVLTVVAIGGTGVSQWWTLHQRAQEQTERKITHDKLAKFIEEGEKLMNLVTSENVPLPAEEVKGWSNRTEQFLGTLGTSYVTRFRSDAGLTGPVLIGADEDHRRYWAGIRTRVIILNEFSAEFAR